MAVKELFYKNILQPYGVTWKFFKWFIKMFAVSYTPTLMAMCVMYLSLDWWKLNLETLTF